MKKTVTILSMLLLVVFCLATLVACGNTPNSNYDEAKANLEKNGYTVSGAKDLDGDIKARINAYKEGEDEFSEGLTIVWCKDEQTAKTYYEEAQNTIKETKEYIEKMLKEETDAEVKKEIQKSLDLYNKIVYGIKGEMVWEGSNEAIKATH